jgi:hypothetical protein
MSFVDSLTPPDTEEIKPGVFLQKRFGKYRLIHPASWEGKMNWKNLFLGGNPLKHLVIFLFIVFLVWSYQHDIQAYQEFYINIRENPLGFCADLQHMIDVPCSEQNERHGLCTNVDYSLTSNFSLNFGSLNESS